jgi:hypothetical protein
MCSGGREAARGYVAGVNDSHNFFVASCSLPARSFCTPTQVTVGQVTDVVCKYLADNPQHRHYGGALLVVHAIAEAFPVPPLSYASLLVAVAAGRVSDYRRRAARIPGVL